MMKDIILQWYDFPVPAGMKMSKWLAAIAVESDDTIYIPAALAGHELTIHLCALYDGVGRCPPHLE